MIALIILVFVDAHDAATPLPEALARAAEEALGGDCSVSIRTLAGDLPLAALVENGRAEQAAMVARIVWADERRLEARLDLAATDGGLARSSTIAFDASDPLAERGRALGLVLAALVAPQKQARLEREKIARATAPPVVAAQSAPPPPTPTQPILRRFAVDAAAGGGFAIGGAGSGVGGSLGLRWHPARWIGWRAGLQARFGEVSSAQAAAMTLAAAAGVALFPVPPSDDRRLALALRAEALLLYEILSHLSADDIEPVRGARLLPGALVVVEGQWALSPTLALALAAGPEIAFGRTDIFVRQEKVAELVPFRLLVQAGLVARF